MATFSKALLSASTNGKQISLTGQAAGSATIIHQAGGGGDIGAIDECWIYATNVTTKEVVLIFEWGAESSSTDEIIMSISPKNGLILAIPGLVITAHLYVKAYCPAARDAVLISGYVNRVT